MRGWILIGSLMAAVGAAACGTPVAQPLDANGAVVSPAAAPERIVYQDAVYERVPGARALARPIAPPAVVRSEVPAQARATEAVPERKAARTWQKRALIIGGSSGAGAGLGALIGGKKGALIGAAIGGGASTLYEVTK